MKTRKKLFQKTGKEKTKGELVGVLPTLPTNVAKKMEERAQKT